MADAMPPNEFGQTGESVTAGAEAGADPIGLGGPPVATWLQDQVTDRVLALQQRAKNLNVAFHDICDGLHSAAAEGE
jgi:hypothetical protein